MAFKKLPARYAKFVMPLVVSIFMSGLVSAVSTLRIHGWSETFVHTWLGNWGMSWVVAFPILFLVMPLARRITSLFVEI